MIKSWKTILTIGSGGFFGVVLRACIKDYISHKVPHPYGTLGVR